MAKKNVPYDEKYYELSNDSRMDARRRPRQKSTGMRQRGRGNAKKSAPVRASLPELISLP